MRSRSLATVAALAVVVASAGMAPAQQALSDQLVNVMTETATHFSFVTLLLNADQEVKTVNFRISGTSVQACAAILRAAVMSRRKAIGDIGCQGCTHVKVGAVISAQGRIGSVRLMGAPSANRPSTEQP